MTNEVKFLRPNIETEQPTPPPQPGLLIEGLAHLHAAAIIDEQTLAGILRVNRRTIRRMVDRGELPAAFKLGRRTTWLAGRIVQHLDRAGQAAEHRAEADDARFRAQRP